MATPAGFEPATLSLEGSRSAIKAAKTGANAPRFSSKKPVNVSPTLAAFCGLHRWLDVSPVLARGVRHAKDADRKRRRRRSRRGRSATPIQTPSCAVTTSAFSRAGPRRSWRCPATLPVSRFGRTSVPPMC